MELEGLMADLLTGQWVRLIAADTAVFRELVTEWGRDSTFWRLSASSPAALFSAQANERFFGAWFNPESNVNMFLIELIAESRIIGDIELFLSSRFHRTSGLGIALGLREDWGKGYGTEAVSLVLGYAFRELNLHRVDLSVYSYNQRAIHAYEKAGFRREGVLRQSPRRAGQWYDTVYMGILRKEWENNNHLETSQPGQRESDLANDRPIRHNGKEIER